MYFLRRLESWLKHRLAIFIQGTWHGRKAITPENYLDQLRVLHKSDHFLVVNKHPDIVMNTNPGDNRVSLFDQIQHRYPELYHPNLGHGFYVLHRLDYSTSGIVVVPLTKKANTQAMQQFEKRLTRKLYLALVRGFVKEDRMEIDIPIGRNPSSDHIMATPDEEGCEKPREAKTRLLVLERGKYSGKPATKVLLAPLTGRRHQLRVHCHKLGHTIVWGFYLQWQEGYYPSEDVSTRT